MNNRVLSRRMFSRRVLSGVVPLLGVAFSLAAGCNSAPPPPGPPIVTKEEVEKIKIGMSLAEAQKIVGNPGNSTKDDSSVPISTHYWTNEDGSLLTLTLMDGKVQKIEPRNFK